VNYFPDSDYKLVWFAEFDKLNWFW